MAGRGRSWLGNARQGITTIKANRFGGGFAEARHGVAWRGEAWHGEARRGNARQGFTTIKANRLGSGFAVASYGNAGRG